VRGVAKLYNYIFSKNAKEQAEFYAKAFNGEIKSIQTFGEAPNADEKNKDKVMHLTLDINGATIFMADAIHEPVKTSGSVDIGLEFASEEEANIAFANLAEGGHVIMPLEKQFWGAMFGRLHDKYGILWQIVTEHE
jgi:PhnB protein